MHPEIKKFWGDRLVKILGSTITMDGTSGESLICWYVISVGFSAYEYETETKYYYNGLPCSEEKILRIIRLKTFL